jgi:hypothetical protein
MKERKMHCYDMHDIDNCFKKKTHDNNSLLFLGQNDSESLYVVGHIWIYPHSNLGLLKNELNEEFSLPPPPHTFFSTKFHFCP